MNKVKKLCMFLCVLTALSLTGCGGTEPEVSIDGHSIKMKDTLQQVMDTDIAVMDNSGERLKSFSSFSSKEVKRDPFNLGLPRIPEYENSSISGAGVSICLYNDSGKTAEAEDCRVFKISYTPDMNEKKSEAPVLINGIDFDGMTAQEAIKAMEEAGYKNKTDEGKYDTLFFKGKDCLITIGCGRQDGDYYITDVDIELDIDIHVER